MPQAEFFAEDPREVGLDTLKVEALFQRAEREVREGLLPSAQMAIARNGKIAAMRTVGTAVQGGVEKPATNETFYVIFSCTKAIISSAVWILMGEGKLDVQERVADIIPEFGDNGKDGITVDQIMLHVAGFPNAPYPPSEWDDRAKRLERFRTWTLEWPAGSRFMYHPMSGFWVLAEIIERRSGLEFKQFVRERIAEPLDLPDLHVGLPQDMHHRVADLVYVGERLSEEERAQLGLPPPSGIELLEQTILSLNYSPLREAGVPGGGGITTAGDLALFYQGLLLNRGIDGAPIWNPEALSSALTVRSGDLTDPLLGVPCNRALGVIVAGDDGLASHRGFGTTNSPLAFGHGGIGGQIGWADPATGISFGYCTNGLDRNEVRQGQRGIAISSLAADCLP